MSDKIIVLIFVGSYLPGYRGGGPIRTIASLVELLGEQLDFKIVTVAHDHGEKKPYEGIMPDTWCKVGKAEVYYASKASLRLFAMARLINSVGHNVLYLNSYFSFNFTIKPLLLRRMKLITNVGTVLAPRGEFSPGALSLKRLKKKIYMKIARAIGLHNKIFWQASSFFERIDIENNVSSTNVTTVQHLIVAPDLVSYKNYNAKPIKYKKLPGSISIVFLSRISPMKNLDGALLMLMGIQGDITFNIFGPAEDQLYWEKCQRISTGLNANIKVLYHGEIAHSDVHKIFSTHHLFFLPTLGENFGHVILEALFSGCPVLLSDQTPWKNLSGLGIGWDLPLDKPDNFKAVLRHCVEMDNDEFIKISQCAADFAKSIIDDTTSLEMNLNIFRSASNIHCTD